MRRSEKQYCSRIEYFTMGQRYIVPGNHRTAQHFLRRGRSNKLILEPGVFVIPVTLDLAKIERVKIKPLIVIAENRSPSPFGMPAAVFILQAIPQCHISQVPCELNAGNELDEARTFAGASPDQLIGGTLDRQEQVGRGRIERGVDRFKRDRRTSSGCKLRCRCIGHKRGPGRWGIRGRQRIEHEQVWRICRFQGKRCDRRLGSPGLPSRNGGLQEWNGWQSTATG